MQLIAFACPVASVPCDIAVRQFAELADPRLARAVSASDRSVDVDEVTLLVVLGVRVPRRFETVAREQWLTLDPSWMAPGREAVQIAKLQRHVRRLVVERGWGRAQHGDAARTSPIPTSGAREP